MRLKHIAHILGHFCLLVILISSKSLLAKPPSLSYTAKLASLRNNDTNSTRTVLSVSAEKSSSTSSQNQKHAAQKSRHYSMQQHDEEEINAGEIDESVHEESGLDEHDSSSAMSDRSGSLKNSSGHAPAHAGSTTHAKNSKGHHVPPPSYQLRLHLYSYKPDSFSMFAEQIALKTYVIGFTYTSIDLYDRYIIRVRYHGYEEYSTNKLKINKTDSNQLILKNFLDAQYIVCVTLFSSSGLPEYPPLSTSDMCLDLVVGEAHPIGGHHSSTGLLSPLLLAVAVVLLFIITVGTKIKKSYLKRVKKRKAKKEKEEKADENRKSSVISDSKNVNQVNVERRPSKMVKSLTEQRLDYILNKDRVEEESKWYAAAQKNKIINASSTYADLSQKAGLLRTNRPAIIYENEAYDDEDERMDADEYDNDENGLEMKQIYVCDDDDSNSLSSRRRKITSLQTLSHVLDNKPWAQRTQQQQQSHLNNENF